MKQHWDRKQTGSVRWSILSVAFIATSLAAFAAPPPTIQQGAVRDVPKEAEIRKEAANSLGFDRALGSKARPLNEKRPQTDSSLLEHSLLLADNETFTIIPEGSILRLPATLRARLVDKPVGDFVYWPNFLKRNAAWLAAKEVPLKMAQGDVKLAKQVLNDVATDPRVVVAVFRGGPIMVLEPAPEEPKTRASSSQASK